MSDTGLPGPPGSPSNFISRPSDKQLLINWRLARMRLNFFKRNAPWRDNAQHAQFVALREAVDNIEHEIDRRGLWYV